MSGRVPKAVALYSGGLDSTLAVLVMMRHGVEVEAIKFLTHFGCDIDDSSSCGANPFPAAEKFGFQVKLCHLGWKFVEIVRHPRYGYGKNMNPCVDCRLLMLQEAKEYMKMSGADFIITGEVLGQRPMSQMRDRLLMISQASDLDGLLVRPLSGKLLPPTRPEIEGLIKREWLLDISGRSRRRQLALAEEFGLEGYASPAGGCLLTDKEYSRRLKDLFAHEGGHDFRDFNLLRIGRHFRLAANLRLIVGRNKLENEHLASIVRDTDTVVECLGVGSPLALLLGEANGEQLALAAAIVARYSDAKNLPTANVNISAHGQSQVLEVVPAQESEVQQHRI